MKKINVRKFDFSNETHANKDHELSFSWDVFYINNI